MASEQSSTTKKIKWGILGCGAIAKQFCSSAAAVNTAEVVACASNTSGKAEAFANAQNISNFYDSYESLLSNPDIDIVYVATTHNFHYQNILLALEHNKAVLSEKPITINAKELLEIAQKAKEKKLFVMEGMWTRFLPTYQQIKQWIREGQIGEILSIRADFGFQAQFHPENRLFNPDLAGGALLDGGIYPISIASFIMDGEKPKTIKSIARIGQTGVDEETFINFQYANGAQASLSCSISSYSPNHLIISGTKGHIHVPKTFIHSDQAILYPENSDPIEFLQPFNQNEGFQFEIEAVHKSLYAKEISCPIMSMNESITIMQTMDEIQKSFITIK